MTCLGCEACATRDTATLIDGRTVCTYCEDWRAECEARAVLAMPKDRRRGYLYGVFEVGRDGVRRLVEKGIEQTRGKAAADALADLVRRVWEAGRAKS